MTRHTPPNVDHDPAPLRDRPPLGDPSTIDDAGLRAERRDRLFAAMSDHDLDVLVLARPAEVAFASGARQLWTAGSRPFGPASVAVAATGRVHLLSVSDFDVPPEIPHEDLYGLWWNPANLARDLASIPGLREAKRVGTTSSSPGFADLLASVAPDAREVDGSPALWEARTPKSPAEIDRITGATAIALDTLGALERGLSVGVTEAHLRAVWLSELATAGAPTPPTEAVARATGRGAVDDTAVFQRLDSTVALAEGELVALDPGAFFRGYEGGVGRTRVIGSSPSPQQADLAARVDEATEAVIERCVAGTTGVELVEAWETTGLAVPLMPLVTGVGLGMEPPVIGAALGHDSVLVDRCVLAVTGWAGSEGAGSVLRRDLVAVDGNDPRVLTAHVPTALDSMSTTVTTARPARSEGEP